MKHIRVDIPFLISILVLVVAGFLIFSSASLGLLSKQAAKYSGVTFNQTFFGLFLGLLACYMTSQINFKIYRKWAFYILVASFLFTLLVFVPHVGVSVGGAARWMIMKPFLEFCSKRIGSMRFWQGLWRSPGISKSTWREKRQRLQ
jgi:cell division protein FtsW (lipid II flippase)